MAGLPTALAGKIVHAINGQPCVEATRQSVTYNVPLSQKFGFAGQIGTAKGQAGTAVRITWAGVAGKQQFDLLALTAQNLSGDLGFDYDFWDGEEGISNHWLIPNCFLGEYQQDNDPTAGTVEKQSSIMGGPPKKIS